jgi:gamma-glutamyl-gamma-aminobutyrate hydrolase PuuD
MLGQSRTYTNSIHHQGVRVNPEGLSFPIAFHEKVVEALQSKNGLGLSVQYHPEIREQLTGNKEFSADGARFLKSIVSYARLIRIRAARSISRCAQLFSN